jgi:hypothetical protein
MVRRLPPNRKPSWDAAQIMGVRERWRDSVGLPLAVWAVAAVTVALAAGAFGYSPSDSSTWARWDSGLYEDIARNGCDLFRCEEEPEKWCGDAGWFPAFSWISGALHLTDLPLRGTAAAVAWLLAGGTIVALWATFLERRADASAVAALVYAAFAPARSTTTRSSPSRSMQSRRSRACGSSIAAATSSAG